MKAKRVVSFLLVIAMLLGTAFATAPQSKSTNSDEIISRGIASCSAYLQEQLSAAHENGTITYGYEWYIITLCRAGKAVDPEILAEYSRSVSAKVSSWTSAEKPTDVERVALALTVTGFNITDVFGVNLAELIYNNPRLSDGANESAYALLALDAAKVEVPETAIWKKDAIIAELLKHQAPNGGFGLTDTAPDVDMTAICLQALSPYQSDPAVKTATESALFYLKNAISPECTFANNANSTAQVLLALASLGINVINPENGFADVEQNLITALETYRNQDGNGYLYDGLVSPMATVQVLQAYDAFRKAEKEGVSYWDFSTQGVQYDDKILYGNGGDSEVQAADPATVFVTIASDGKLALDKNGGHMVQAAVTVIDRNGDGTLSYDEALYAAHEAYYPGGANAGYSSFNGQHGLSLAVLWGKGNANTSAAAGYYLNDASCWSLADPVEEGDRLTAFNYKDTVYWSDSYSFFTEHTVSVKSDVSVTLTLNASGYDSDFNLVTAPYANANVVLLGEDALQECFVTDANGTVQMNLSNSGTYYAVATTESGTLVPAVCKIVVTKSSGGSGSEISNGIMVSIRVADPKGKTYLAKKSYTVDKGTSVFALLKKTGLEIEVSTGAYDSYVKAIEGLAEFDEGPKSGWMYRVNGSLPSRSAHAYILSRADDVEWLYTRDLGDDLSDDFSSGDSDLKDDTTEDAPHHIPKSFSDVRETDWYYDAVAFSAKNGLMIGNSDTTFNPNGAVTRAQLVTILHRLDGSPNIPTSVETTVFTDVTTGWYSDAVHWAASEKIVEGFNGKFRPDDPITREQIATILHRYTIKRNYDVSVGKNTNILSYADFENLSEYAIAPMRYVTGAGLIKGRTESTLNPLDHATRAEFAMILMRFCINVVKQ